MAETGSATAVSHGDGHEACDAWIARLQARLTAVRQLAALAAIGFTAACCCDGCEAAGRGEPVPEGWQPHPSRPLAWDLDPAAVLAALDGETP
jgi:hypothetical protein